MDEGKYVLAFQKLKTSSPAFLAGLVVSQTKKLDASKELLKKIEWKYDSDYDVEKCPSCDNIKSLGHKEACELKAIVDDMSEK